MHGYAPYTNLSLQHVYLMLGAGEGRRTFLQLPRRHGDLSLSVMDLPLDGLVLLLELHHLLNQQLLLSLVVVWEQVIVQLIKNCYIF